MRTVTIQLLGNTWHAEIMAPIADRNECIDLFDTATLPTPYTSHCTFQEVKAGLEQANPEGVIVELGKVNQAPRGWQQV
jgi:hypothetical protein